MSDAAHAPARIVAATFREFMPARDANGLGAACAAQVVAAPLGPLGREVAPPPPGR